MEKTMFNSVKNEMNNKSNLSIDYENDSSKLVFPVFDGIPVSTKTFVVVTNLIFDIDKLFEYLPCMDYVLIPKKRGRKKKIEPDDPNKNIPSGSIITLEYQNKIRGVDLKKKNNEKKNKEKKKRGTYFRNSITIVMIIDNKKINFKVSRNGKFQMTGCKYDIQSEKCVKYIWGYINKSTGIYNIQENLVPNKQNDNIQKSLKIIFIPAMRNIDFALNFFVDREKLDEYFNTSTNYHSLLETSFGYTGVNIKIPIVKSIYNLMLKKIEFVNNDWLDPVFVPYIEYLDMLSEKDASKKLKKQRYNTFLVFHSGKVIMSGMEETFMKDVYYEFLDIIRKSYHIIEEKLEEKLDN